MKSSIPDDQALPTLPCTIPGRPALTKSTAFMLCRCGSGAVFKRAVLTLIDGNPDRVTGAVLDGSHIVLVTQGTERGGHIEIFVRQQFNEVTRLDDAPGRRNKSGRSGPWSVAASLMWDRETEAFVDKPNKDVDTFALAGTVSYSISKWFNVGTGLGKGIADTDNSSRSIKFSNGDWSTGIVAGLVTQGMPFW